MKIKTIRHRLDNVKEFDDQLNKALEDGYQLVNRGLVPGFRLDGGGYLHNMLYAELVLPDPEPAQEPAEEIDPFQVLRQVKEICEAVTDSCNNCPIKDWCFGPLKNGDDPTDWELPEVEA